MSTTLRRLGLALLAAVALGWLILHTGGAARDTQIVVPPGATLTAAARSLEEADAISSSRAFLLRARLFGPHGAIKPGEYRIVKGMSARELLALLQSGRVIQRFVTIPEGLPSVMVHERLMRTPLLTGTIPVPAEGSILPDNYAYTRGESRAAVVARMQAAMRRALAEEWARRSPSAVVATPEQTVNLAAIVEKETGRPDERRLVAAVYSNRLRIGMPLQADPTLIYPVTRGRPLGRRILRSEIAADTPYNTYTRTGLPAGPITNPGRAAIAAVLDPAPIRALYFVAQGDGRSAFAETLDDHNANVARWYAHRRARGEM